MANYPLVTALQVWTGEQAAAILAFVDDGPLRAMWHLALGTGARRRELLGLRWVDVGLDAAEVRIRRSLSVIDGVPRLLGTKTSRARSLSVGVSVTEALREHRALEDRRRAEVASWEDPDLPAGNGAVRAVPSRGENSLPAPSDPPPGVQRERWRTAGSLVLVAGVTLLRLAGVKTTVAGWKTELL